MKGVREGSTVETWTSCAKIWQEAISEDALVELGKVFTYLCSPHTKRQAGTGISKNKTKPILYHIVQ